ncbi:MAG: T9SS type A sorting domain-containing protein [Bacteroidetes bacterium]|nr:T9SS type A sorting domain-containing protein [Bacteroidota bacterium]
MRNFLLFMLFCAFSTVYSQTAQGPAVGSYASGVYVSTNSFTNQPVVRSPKFETVRNKIRYKGEPWSIVTDAKLPGEKEIYREGGNPAEAGGVALLKSFEGNTESNSIPPDPHVAVGPDHIVGTVNSDFGIWDKKGNLLKRISANTWFSAFLVDPFDPKVVYDHFAQRWVMVWLDQRDLPQSGSILISVSDDSNPLGTWRNWILPSNMNGNTTTSNWGDYQGVGYDAVNFYVTSNQFNFGGYFDYAKIRVIKKDQIYNNPTDTCKWYDFWDVKYPGSSQRVFNIRPVIHFNNADTAYLVHVPYYSSNAYALYKITYDQQGVPSLTGSAVPVTAFSDPPQASQPGGALLESSGPELTNEPVYRDGFIWLTHSTRNPSSGAFSAVRVCKLNPSTATPVEQLTFGTANTWYFYPAIMTDKSGNIVFTVSRSSQSEYVSAYYVGKQSGSNSFTQAYCLQAGVGQYQKDYGSGRNRWGDYLGMSLDPSGETFWMMSEYVSSSNSWSNRIGEVRMMPVPGASLLTDRPSLNFATMERAVQKDTLTVQLINLGVQPLVISGINKSNSNFTLLGPATYPATVASFDSLELKVVCDPQVAGILKDTLVILDNDPADNRIPLVVESYYLNPAEQQKIFVVTNSTNSGNTFSINKSTGEATLLGTSGAISFTAIAAHPKTGVIYGLMPSGAGTVLHKMDANSGKLYPKTTIDLSEVFSCAFDTSGNLFLLSKRNLLYRYDEPQNSAIRVDSVKTSLNAMAFDPFTNQLFAAVYKPLGSGKDQIVKVNIGTGDTVKVGFTGTNKLVRDIFFDETGNLFGFTGMLSETANLYAISKNNGTGTLVGSTGLVGIVSSAYYPGVINSIGNDGLNTLITDYKLYDNYPNPFNPNTMIRFSIPSAGTVTLNIYNILGEKVAQLVNGYMAQGDHKVEFDASGLNSGVYFYEMKSGDFRMMKKMILLK